MSTLGLLYPLVPPSGILATTSALIDCKAPILIAATPKWLEIFEIDENGFKSGRKRMHTPFSPSCMSSFRPPSADSDWIALIDGSELIILELDHGSGLKARYKFAAAPFTTSSTPSQQLIAVDPSRSRILAHMGTNMFIEVSFTAHNQPPKVKTFSFAGNELKRMVWLDDTKVMIVSEVYEGLQQANAYSLQRKRFLKVADEGITFDEAVGLLPGPAGECYVVTKREVRWASVNGASKTLQSFNEDIVSCAMLNGLVYVVLVSGKVGWVRPKDLKKKTLLQLHSVPTSIHSVADQFIFGHNEVGTRLLLDADGKVLFQESLLGAVTGLEYSLNKNGQQRFGVVQSGGSCSALSEAKFSCHANTVGVLPNSAGTLLSWESRVVSTNVLGSQVWHIDLTSDQKLIPSSSESLSSDLKILALSSNIIATTQGVRLDGEWVFKGDLECASIHNRTVIAGIANKIFMIDTELKKHTVEEQDGNIYSVLKTEGHTIYSTMETLCIDKDVQLKLERCHQLALFQDSIVACHPSGWVTFLNFEGQILARCFVGKFVTAVTNSSGKCLLVGSGHGALVRLTPWGLNLKRLEGLPEGSGLVHLGDSLYAIGGKAISIFHLNEEDISLSIETQLISRKTASGLVRTGQNTWATLVTNNETSDGSQNDIHSRMMLAEIKNFKVGALFELEGMDVIGQDLIYIEIPEHSFQGIVAVGNSSASFNEVENEKSVIVLFDLKKHELVAKEQVEGTITALKGTHGRHFLVAVDSVVQSWSLKFSDKSDPKLYYKGPAATVGRYLSCLDYFGSSLLVADQVMSVSIASAKGTIKQKDIATCPSIKWPMNGVLIESSPGTALVSTLDKELVVLAHDDLQPGGLAPILNLKFGQIMTCSIRSSYGSYLDLLENQSKLLAAIAPDVFFGTDAGAIYGFKLVKDETAKVWESIAELTRQKLPCQTNNEHPGVFDTSQLLLHGPEIRVELSEDSPVTVNQFDEAIYAVQKLYS